MSQLQCAFQKIHLESEVEKKDLNNWWGVVQRVMEENQLNAYLKNLPKYQGSFALNELKDIEIKSFPNFFIINLANRIEEGTHWIAVGVYQNTVFVCDSLGGLIPDKQFPTQLINFLHVLTDNRKLFITKQLQPLDSNKCGEYCILFVLEMSKTNSFRSFLSLFTNNLYQNDIIMSFLCNCSSTNKV